jgi:hypothetical protein
MSTLGVLELSYRATYTRWDWVTKVETLWKRK